MGHERVLGIAAGAEMALGRAPRPSDIIDEATWDSIVTLPDDVAVRTTDYHGTTLKQLDELWGAWIECVGEKQDSMFPVMLDAGDDFQKATYNALTDALHSLASLRLVLAVAIVLPNVAG